MKKFAIGIAVFVAVVLGGSYLFPGATLSAMRALERGAAGFEQKTVNVANHDIVYLEGGQGQSMLLLHGFGADKDHWTRLNRSLKDQFRVVAPDLPGFGESSYDESQSYDVAQQVARVHSFVREVDIPRPFVLGGNSMGGNIAGAYAAAYPTDVKALILLDAAGVSSAEQSELRRIIEETGENPLVARNVEEFEQLIAMNFVNPPYIPYAIKSYLTERAIAAQDRNARIFSDYIREPVALEPLVPALTMPVLVIWGDSDRVLHVSGAVILGERIPGAKVVIMKDTGHLPMLEHPAETARVIAGFAGEAQN